LPEGISLSNNYWINCFSYYEGRWWIMAGENLAVFDGKNWTVYKIPKSYGSEILVDPVNSILWISSLDNLIAIDISKHPINIQPALEIPITESIRSSFVDNTGILWLGTNARGIRKFNPKTKIFHNYLPNHSIYSTPAANGKGKVFLKYILSDFPIQALLNTSTNQSTLAYAQEYCADNEGNFWALQFPDNPRDKDRKINLLNHNLDPVRTISLPIDPTTWINKMLYLKEDKIAFIGNKDLFFLDVKSEQLKRFPIAIDATVTDLALAIHANGRCWISTDNGLIKGEPNQSNGYTIIGQY
jgi:hypothetical protein